jgi:hypothetical protein
MKYDHLGMLPERAFKPIGKRMTLEGGGGGGGEQKSYSTNLPEYAKPYYEELLKQTGKQTFDVDAEGNVTGVKGAGNLPQQKVVGFQDYQKEVQQNIANLGTPNQFAQSTQGLGTGQQLGYGTAMAGINQAFGYQPSTYQAQNVGSQVFGQGAADYYTNPYAQNVTNTALREAMQKGAMDKNALMSGAIGRGTFGGARNTLLQAEQNRGLNQQLSDIQYRGSSDAYTNAQQQFQADQQRRMQADLANQQAGLSANQQNVQGQQYAAGLGKDIGLAGLQVGVDSSKALGALGTEQQQADLARLQAQQGVGAAQQTQAQKEADIQYQNEMAKQNYQKQQLQYYSDILRGNAGALGSTQVNYTPAPSALSQIGGLGIGALGLAKAYG